MEEKSFDINQSGLLVHGINVGLSPEDSKYGTTRLKKILEGNWPLGKKLGGNACFNLTGVRLKGGNRVGFEPEADYSLYARDTGEWYTCPYIILNDILKKISPNFVKQATENGIANDASWEQILLYSRGFHLGNIKWVAKEDWITSPYMPCLEDPQPEFFPEIENENKYYPPTRDMVSEEQMFNRVLSPNRINAIVVPRKIGRNPENPIWRKDLERKPQEYFLEELCKIRENVGEEAKNIPIYDDLGTRLL